VSEAMTETTDPRLVTESSLATFGEVIYASQETLCPTILPHNYTQDRVMTQSSIQNHKWSW
jgi:hypothetical protein